MDAIEIKQVKGVQGTHIGHFGLDRSRPLTFQYRDSRFGGHFGFGCGYATYGYIIRHSAFIRSIFAPKRTGLYVFDISDTGSTSSVLVYNEDIQQSQ